MESGSNQTVQTITYNAILRTLRRKIDKIRGILKESNLLIGRIYFCN